jgi:hypothetical protein
MHESSIESKVVEGGGICFKSDRILRALAGLVRFFFNLSNDLDDTFAGVGVGAVVLRVGVDFMVAEETDFRD